MVLYKIPAFENDSYMFVIDLKTDSFAEIPKEDVEYYLAKYKAFKEKNISKIPFEKFKDRPSFANFDSVKNLFGTIYTYCCQAKNRMDYGYMMKQCRKQFKKSRRCSINFADGLSNYLDSTKNTSCLNAIHYCSDNVTIYFRASDIKNELLIDLRLINRYFVKPVGDFKTLTVMASTAQNVEQNLFNLIQ